MYQGKTKTRLQAEKMADDRLRMLISRYPNQSILKGLNDDEVYRKLEICYGKEYVNRSLSISNIEAQIKSRIKRAIIVFSFVIVCVVAWNATLLSMWAIPALLSNSGSLQTWSAVLATVIVDGVFGWWIAKNVKAIQSGSVRIKMDKVQ